MTKTGGSTVEETRLRLPDVTLVAVEGVEIERTLLAADICEAYCAFGGVTILSAIPSGDSRVVSVPPMDLEGYNRFLIKELHRYVATSHALVIQHDGFVLNPAAWSDEFLQYDYVGAPWAVRNGRAIGNGGFSLRSRRLLETAAALIDVPRYWPEDRLLCVRWRDALEARGMRFAPEAIADRFSREGNPAHGVAWTGQFGFHSFRNTDLSQWTFPDGVQVGPGQSLKAVWDLERRTTFFLLKLRQSQRRMMAILERAAPELAPVLREAGRLPGFELAQGMTGVPLATAVPGGLTRNGPPRRHEDTKEDQDVP